MKNLAQIVNLVTRKRLKKIELLQDIIPIEGKDNKYYELYQGIRSGKIQTDEEAASYLYDSSPSSKKYLMLKSRFRKRLLNSLFFINENDLEVEAYNKFQYRSIRDLFLLKILRLTGIRVMAVSLGKKLLKKSMEYELYEIAFQAADILRYFSIVRGDLTKYQRYYETLTNK
jgi:hypothetical protein